MHKERKYVDEFYKLFVMRTEKEPEKVLIFAEQLAKQIQDLIK